MGQYFDLLAQEDVLNDGLASGFKNALGFHSIVVRNYEGIKCSIMHSIIKYHLPVSSGFPKAAGMSLKK